MALILAIESTCDETAAAVVEGGRAVLCSVVATQYELHAKFRGVVPEIASRAHIESILPVVRQAMESAGVLPADLSAVAVANRPGLIGSLLVGVTSAKTLAFAWDKPLVGVDHVHAHLYSALLDHPDREVLFPAVGAVLSGGHTAIYHLRSWTDISRIGGTIDDAVGEAYDKVAATLGLGFPGGPAVDALAQTGDPQAVRFPRTLFARDSLDFSFSGLKTAVLYRTLGPQGLGRKLAEVPPAERADIAAGFQLACLDVIEEKLRRAAHQFNAQTILVGGGVVSNAALRGRLARLPVPVLTPEQKYCTDNAAMIAGLADVLLAGGRVSGLDLDAVTSSWIT